MNKSPKEWPLVVQNDDGIRPAGRPDECFYCSRRIGQPHEADCVIVTKRVRVRYSFEIEIEMPHSWTEGDILFHRNASSWCADNALGDLEAFRDLESCLCAAFSCEYIGVSDDTPRRKVRVCASDPTETPHD